MVNFMVTPRLRPLALTDRRWLRFTAFTSYYFAQGVPIGLFSIAIPAALAEQGRTVAEVLWLAGWVNLPWALKLIVGPFMDRFRYLPMGNRRPWVMLAQTGLVTSFVGMALLEPTLGGSLVPIAVCGIVINSFAASQDVAVDGMAIDVLPSDERGRANALMGFGQAAGFACYGALCTRLIHSIGVEGAALFCAASVGLILIVVAVVRERPGEKMMPWGSGQASAKHGLADRHIAQIGSDIFRVLLLPMSLLLMLVEFLNRFRDGIALGVFPVFGVQEIGLSDIQYADFSFWATLGAAIFGALLGPSIDRFGARRFLLIALFGAAICHVVVGLLETLWTSMPFMVTLAVVNAAFGQLVFVTTIAIFMTICWSKVSATQFAIYMAMANLSRSIGSWVFAGVDESLDLGYRESFFVMAGLLIVAALLLTRFNASSHADRVEQFDSDRGSGKSIGPD